MGTRRVAAKTKAKRVKKAKKKNRNKTIRYIPRETGSAEEAKARFDAVVAEPSSDLDVEEPFTCQHNHITASGKTVSAAPWNW